MKRVYIICAKCGSDRMIFEIDDPNDEACGVYITCLDCGELTSVEAWNESKENGE